MHNIILQGAKKKNNGEGAKLREIFCVIGRQEHHQDKQKEKHVPQVGESERPFEKLSLSSLGADNFLSSSFSKKSVVRKENQIKKNAKTGINRVKIRGMKILVRLASIFGEYPSKNCRMTWA